MRCEAVAHKIILICLFFNLCSTLLVPQTLPKTQPTLIFNPFSYKLINYSHSYGADVNTKQFNDTKNHICIVRQFTDIKTFTVSQFIYKTIQGTNKMDKNANSCSNLICYYFSNKFKMWNCMCLTCSFEFDYLQWNLKGHQNCRLPYSIQEGGMKVFFTPFRRSAGNLCKDQDVRMLEPPLHQMENETH